MFINFKPSLRALVYWSASRTIALLAPFAMLACLQTQSLASIRSSFDSDLEGWSITINGGTLPIHTASGGNPGGFFDVIDGGGGVMTAVAPAKFLGNLTAYNGETFSFDAKILVTGGADPTDSRLRSGEVTISNGIDSATIDLAPSGFTTDWATYSADFTSITWGKTESSWQAILGNVTSIQIAVDSTFGTDRVGLDNVVLTGDGNQAVPEPSSLILWSLAAGCVLLGYRRRRVANT